MHFLYPWDVPGFYANLFYRIRRHMRDFGCFGDSFTRFAGDAISASGILFVCKKFEKDA